MAEEIGQLETHDKKAKDKKAFVRQEPVITSARLIRILGKDIPGDKKVYHGLTFIKGISWSFSNAVCKSLGINKDKRVEELTEQEIKKISEFVLNPKLPLFMLNRRKDYDTGADKHLNGADLDLQKDFDIKRLKKIKAYKGVRHSQGQPVRGQRTKSHFRNNRKKTGAVGVKKVKEAAPAKTAAPAKKK